MTQVVVEAKPEPEAYTLEEAINQLPKDFLNFVEKLAKKTGGRRYFLADYKNPLEETLEICKMAWLQNKTIYDISKKYKVNASTIYRLLKNLEQWKEQITTFILEIKPKIYVNIRNHPIIKKWEERIRVSGSHSALRYIPVICKILEGKDIPEFRCTPEEFDLKKAQEYVNLWLAKHPDKKILDYTRRMGIRHFLQVGKEINIPRNFGKIYGLSGEKVSYGKYSHVKLSKEQIDKIREHLQQNNLEYVLAFFDYCLEAGGRFSAMLKTEITRIEINSFSITARIYESKTDKWWNKYILTKFKHGREAYETIKAWIEKVKAKGWKYLFLPPNKEEIKKLVGDFYFNKKLRKEKPFRRLESYLAEKLREAYRYAGVTEQYFYRKPFHALRHASAQLWLQRTNWDYGLVAEVCGWEDVKTLMDCYGGLTPEIVAQKIAMLKGD